MWKSLVIYVGAEKTMTMADLVTWDVVGKHSAIYSDVQTGTVIFYNNLIFNFMRFIGKWLKMSPFPSEFHFGWHNISLPTVIRLVFHIFVIL